MDQIQNAESQWVKLEATVNYSRSVSFWRQYKLRFKANIAKVLIVLGGGGTTLLVLVDKIAHAFGICLGF